MILYKYQTAERINVLKDCLIRYTQPIALNDPFEVKPNFQKFANEEETIRKFEESFLVEMKKNYDQVPLELQNNVSFEKFLEYARQQVPDYINQFKEMLDSFIPMARETIYNQFGSIIGILSLTEKQDNMLMWAHYAASHEGFIIGFDSTHPYFHRKRSDFDEFGYLRKVVYRDNCNEPLKPMIDLTADDTFLTKDLEWAYEEEWRVLLPLENADRIEQLEPYPVYLFGFPPDAVYSIILGYRMQEQKKMDIIETLKFSSDFSHVRIKQAKVDAMGRKMEFYDIN